MSVFAKLLELVFGPDEEYEDPDFGRLRREHKGFWEGEFAVPYGANFVHQRMSLSIDSGTGKPTEAQKGMVKEILGRYPELWPEIAAVLAQYHDELKTVEAIVQHVKGPRLCLDPLRSGQPRKWSIDYETDLEHDPVRYAVQFQEWQLRGCELA